MIKAKKTISAVLALSLALSLVFSGCSKKSDNGKLTVATNAEFQPFEYMDNNKIVGIDVDIVNEIAKGMGETPEIQNMNFDSVIPSVTTGKSELGVAGITKTPDREKSVDFSDPYYDAKNMVIVKSDNTTITDKDSLKGKKIAVQKATTGDDLATGITGDSNVVRFDATTDAATELKNGKVDAVIIDSFPAQTLVKQNKDLKLLEGVSFSSEQYCIAVKKGNKDLLAKVNKIIKQMKDSGEIDKIVKKYE